MSDIRPKLLFWNGLRHESEIVETLMLVVDKSHGQNGRRDDLLGVKEWV